MGWGLRLSDTTVRKFAELPTYCQRQKCSPGNVVSGSIRFTQIIPGVRWRGGVKWEWGRWKWRFSLHSFTVFRTLYIHGHTTAFMWYDCQWPWAYFKVIGLFRIKFLKNGVWYGKSYYRLLIGNRTLAFDWCHFWWPWSTFDGQEWTDKYTYCHQPLLSPVFCPVASNCQRCCPKKEGTAVIFASFYVHSHTPLNPIHDYHKTWNKTCKTCTSLAIYRTCAYNFMQELATGWASHSVTSSRWYQPLADWALLLDWQAWNVAPPISLQFVTFIEVVIRLQLNCNLQILS